MSRLQGYTIPRSPAGRASLVPAPPWHYVGDFLVVDFWADPDAAAQVCDAIAATGALEAARAEALAIVAAAKAELPALPEAQHAALDLVADGVVDRYA